MFWGSINSCVQKALFEYYSLFILSCSLSINMRKKLLLTMWLLMHLLSVFFLSLCGPLSVSLVCAVHIFVPDIYYWSFLQHCSTLCYERALQLLSTTIDVCCKDRLTIAVVTSPNPWVTWLATPCSVYISAILIIFASFIAWFHQY